VLTDGFNHVAVLTSDTDRFIAFYTAVFDAEVMGPLVEEAGMTLTGVRIGEWAEFNVFQKAGNTEADHQTPMFGRGRLDHIAIQAASLEAFETIRDRLIERGATDGFVTDFGPILSCFYVDPDGLESEVCVGNPDWVPGTFNPPGTPAKRYQPDA
jgi:catechol 2,3-dioxygenase-like lactoylglutathione lyase family enzyme